jgi:NtrC-family two-component system sensor histidine kinase KinB
MASKIGHSSFLLEMKPSLEKLLNLEPSFRQVVLFDLQQQEVLRISRASKTISGQLMEFDKKEIFPQLNKGETYISSVYIDKVTNEPMVAIAVPIKNVFGDLEGALVAEVNLKFMWELVGQLKVGNGGLAYVVDKKGNLIAFGDISRVLKEENLASLEKVSEFIKGVKTADKSLIAYSRGILGTKVVSDYASLGTPDWAVVVELPIGEAYAGVIYQLEFTVLIIILIIAIGAGLSFYLSRIITKPIISLSKAVAEISKGNLDTRAEIKSRDEIGKLAEDFNNMAKEIQTRTKKLSEGLSRLQSLVESVSLGVIMMDLNLNVVLSNSTASKMLGKPLSKKISIADLSEKIKGNIDISQALSYYVQLGAPLNIQEVIINEKYIRLFMSPVRDISEKVFIGAVVVMEDISEQKKLDKIRTEIVSITSHQLRTPSTIIKGNLEMLMDKKIGELNEDQKDVLNEAYCGNKRMICLINDLMDVAKIDEGRFKPILEPAQLEKLVAEAVEVLIPLAKERKVALEYHQPAAALAAVKINPQRVMQALQNVIDNALKYSSSREGGKVEVEIVEKTKELEVIVKDNGIGIPADEQGKIFERFSRGSNSTTLDPGGGSGLGLYIAKAVIESNGGRIWFESKENEGTIFHTTYPYN